MLYYEFHQFPGYQAGISVAKLVQEAYWSGLDGFGSPGIVFPNRFNMDQECVDD